MPAATGARCPKNVRTAAAPRSGSLAPAPSGSSRRCKALFPQARTLRWDAETTQHKGAHDVILSHFAEHRADVLVGTQMLAKGLDLPLVTLVGAILAETALNLPDYRAGERTFQVLTQVAGRAGRSALGGQVIFQTFQPDHYAIQAAAGHDYASFYRQELVYRRQLRYPPFSRLVRLEYRHAQARAAETAAGTLAGQVRAWLQGEDRRATDLIGPLPCFFSRLNGLYRWQIILRGPDPASLLSGRPLPELARRSRSPQPFVVNTLLGACAGSRVRKWWLPVVRMIRMRLPALRANPGHPLRR